MITQRISSPLLIREPQVALLRAESCITSPVVGDAREDVLRCRPPTVAATITARPLHLLICYAEAALLAIDIRRDSSVGDSLAYRSIFQTNRMLEMCRCVIRHCVPRPPDSEGKTCWHIFADRGVRKLGSRSSLRTNVRSVVGLMALENHELSELNRIGLALLKDDPELARKLSKPIRCTCHFWMALSYATLAVCALLLCMGLALRDVTAPMAGGLALMTAYPLFLVMAKRRRPLTE
ncbi:DUF3040 domain-containing protein [Pseudonocardia acidicola]|uniref:DUF3040 domain-containing protein n=1 Tax=Pseudonocardia acidicola TaxID=2724939 RepID=A0ABX1SC47_9PSEU|nr:DUF3040 domain-containing protein [Pseudonocardia acidicola]NMH98447.1 DUF3040 domain-containing protein [Pseudonocardia acidicola]